MFSPSSQSVLLWLRSVTVLQTALLLAAYVSGLRKDRIYPAMRAYLLVNAIGGILVCTLLGLPGLLVGNESTVYCTLFWVAYGTSGVLTFFTAQQIFRDALEPLPGLRRLALVAFRWVAVVSVALSVVPAIVPLFFRAHSLQVTVLQAMRCVSVLEFCLVAFILLSARFPHAPSGGGLDRGLRHFQCSATISTAHRSYLQQGLHVSGIPGAASARLDREARRQNR